MADRPYLAKSNVICRNTEQMAKNHMIKITEGWMVNTPQQLGYQGADEQKGEARAARGGSSKVTSSKIVTVPLILDYVSTVSQELRMCSLHCDLVFLPGMAEKGVPGRFHKRTTQAKIRYQFLCYLQIAAQRSFQT